MQKKKTGKSPAAERADRLNRRVRVVIDSGDPSRVDKCRRNLSKENVEDITIENFRSLWTDYFTEDDHAANHDHFGKFNGSTLAMELDFRSLQQKQRSADLENDVPADVAAARAPLRGPKGDVGPSNERSAARKERRRLLATLHPHERVLVRKSYKAANRAAHAAVVHPKRRKKPGTTRFKKGKKQN